MPKRVVRRHRFEAEMERMPLTPAQERRLRRDSLDRAPADLEAWRSATTRQDRFYAVPRAAMAAYLLGDDALAQELAQEALALAPDFCDDWNHGNAVHFGHTVRGLLALRENQVAQAVAALHEAGATPGSPQLNSFGPTMQLARDLLRHGERQAVLHYFAQCRRFWKMGTRWLDIWEKKVGRGAMPNFVMQLYR